MNGSTILPVTGGGTASVPSAGAVLSTGSALTSIAAGTSGNVLTDNGTTWVSSPPSGGGGGQFIVIPTAAANTLGPPIEDFLWGTAQNFYISGAIAPQGAMGIYITSSDQNIAAVGAVATGDGDRAGILNISNAGTAIMGAYMGDTSIILGTAAYEFACAVNFTAVPNGSNNQSIVFGFSNAWPSLGNGPVFAIDLTLSGTNWYIGSYDTGSATFTSTTVPFAANTWYNLRINVNAAGSLATFSINGTSVGTISSNIPITSSCGPGFRISGNSAANTVVARFDWWNFNYKLNANRGTY
jgi:hypothetical protein